MASLLLGTSSMASQLLYPSSSSPSSLSSTHSISGASLSSFSYSPPTLSLQVSAPSLPSIYCGRGDRKTAKGKRFAHSYGNARPRNKKKGRGPPKVPVPPSAPRKDPFENDEIVHIELTDE